MSTPYILSDFYKRTRYDVSLNLVGYGYMVFNATFNNITAISWRSFLGRKPEYPAKTTDTSPERDLKSQRKW